MSPQQNGEDISPKQFQIHPLIDFVNGSLSGVGNCLSGFVFDTLKVRMQLNPNITMTESLRSIVRNEGILHLFNGIYYPIVTVPLVNAVVFGSYELYKKVMRKQELSFIDGIENGAVAGLVNSVIVSPVELVKCIMQNDKKNRFSSSQECLKSILRNNGIRGVFKGTVSTIYREVPAYAAQFATYEALKSYRLQGLSKKHLDLGEGIVIGGLAGLSCWIFSYPQDIIKTKLQVEQSSLGSKYKSHPLFKDGGFYECGKQIYLESGLKGFWRGISPCLIRAFVANAVGIAIYEKAQQYCRHSKVSLY